MDPAVFLSRNAVQLQSCIYLKTLHKRNLHLIYKWSTKVSLCITVSLTTLCLSQYVLTEYIYHSFSQYYFIIHQLPNTVYPKTLHLL